MANGDINVRIAAAGDMTQGRNEINPRFQANALRNARGLDCGVLANDFYNESADYLGITRGANSGGEPFEAKSYSASSITIGAGMATAYGYDLQIEQNIALTTDENGSALTAATGYLFVYLEWDLTGSPAVGDIKIHNNGTAGVWRSIYTDNDNLIENPQGKYKLPLHRFYKASTGSIRYDGNWETLNLARTIERPQVAEVALYAETMDEGNDSDRVATTKYCNREINEQMEKMQTLLDNTIKAVNFSEGTPEAAGVPINVRRLCNVYQISSTGTTITKVRDTTNIEGIWLPQDFDGTKQIGTLPEELRPKNEVTGLSAYFTVGGAYYNDSGTLLWNYRAVSLSLSLEPDGAIISTGSPDSSMSTTLSQYSNSWNFQNYGVHLALDGEFSFDAGSTDLWNKHPVNLSYDATKAYVSAPSYFEAGKSFEIRAIALTPAQEASVSVSGGSVSGGERGNGAKGNGAFTITPTSSATSLTITVTTANIDVGGSTGSTTEA